MKMLVAAVYSLLWSTAVFAMAGAAPSHAKPSPNDSTLQKLFHVPTPSVQNPAHHTFVFWVNGDQDHFFTASSMPSPGESSPKMYRVDKFEVQNLEQIARSCQACNIVLLHDQRGSARWYTANKPWATYLRVFSRGKPLLDRHVDEIDETDPRLLSQLLEFAQAAFPQSDLHLIYRGHSFRAPYQPGSKEIAPFDYSNPNQGYGQRAFLQGLEQAKLSRPLGSLTLASCSMASVELVAKMTAFARFFVGSEVDVLEVLNVGFRFNSLLQVTDTMDDKQVSWALAYGLLDAFRTAPFLHDAMMEYPTTWTDLAAIPEVISKLNLLSRVLQGLSPERRDPLYAVIRHMAKLTKAPSNRFIDSLRGAGKTEQQIDFILQQLQVPSNDPHDLDLGKVLRLIATRPETDGLQTFAKDLQDLIYDTTWVINEADHSKKLGLSISFQDPPLALLPQL